MNCVLLFILIFALSHEKIGGANNVWIIKGSYFTVSKLEFSGGSFGVQLGTKA